LAALGLMAVLLAGAAWLAWQRPAAASAILSRLPSRRVAAIVDRVRDFEQRTYGSAGSEGARLGLVALFEATFHALSFAECWITLRALTGESLPLQALVLDSVGRVINVVFRLIPYRIGVDEVSAETVARAIGLASGTGVALAIVRKLRMIVWGSIGLLLWTRIGKSTNR
jgi:hypothetical protein